MRANRPLVCHHCVLRPQARPLVPSCSFSLDRLTSHPVVCPYEDDQSRRAWCFIVDGHICHCVVFIAATALLPSYSHELVCLVQLAAWTKHGSTL